LGSRADPGFDPGRSIMGFTLRNGISFCRVGDRIIFLDIEADRYFCLSRSAEHSFRALADGATPPPDDAHVQGLLARGVLMASAALGLRPPAARSSCRRRVFLIWTRRS
jgi:hypothetical protein